MRNVLRSLLADLGMFFTALAMMTGALLKWFAWDSWRKPERRPVVKVDSAERDERARLGIGLAYPEYVTRELPEKQEEWLAELATCLWPDDEYGDIVRELRGDSE